MPFTAATAKAASAKGHAIRWATPDDGNKPDRYVAEQLLRTRRQIDLLNDILESPTTEMKDRKAAAESKARLYEIEAALANRPKPGNRRPAEEKKAKVTPTTFDFPSPPVSSPPTTPTTDNTPPASPEKPF